MLSMEETRLREVKELFYRCSTESWQQNWDSGLSDSTAHRLLQHPRLLNSEKKDAAQCRKH